MALKPFSKSSPSGTLRRRRKSSTQRTPPHPRPPRPRPAPRLPAAPRSTRGVEETLAVMDREVAAPAGGFYAALDADSGGEEGLSYVWTAAQIDAAFTNKADAELIKKVYGAEGPPNFESHYYILRLSRPVEDVAVELKMPLERLQARLQELRPKLLEVRAARPRPFLDTKVLASWNGQIIA